MCDSRILCSVRHMVHYLTKHACVKIESKSGSSWWCSCTTCDWGNTENLFIQASLYCDTLKAILAIVHSKDIRWGLVCRHKVIAIKPLLCMHRIPESGRAWHVWGCWWCLPSPWYPCHWECPTQWKERMVNCISSLGTTMESLYKDDSELRTSRGGWTRSCGSHMCWLSTTLPIDWPYVLLAAIASRYQ